MQLYAIVTMDFKLVSLVLCSFCLFFSPTIFAIKKPYIVYMGSHSHALHESSQHVERVRTSHLEFLSSFLSSDEKVDDSIIYSYKRDINGFAAKLTEEQAAEIEKHPNVVSVFLNTAAQLLTTRSWEFLSMTKTATHSSFIWNQANYGEDIIIANLDTGAWPEAESFSDEGYGPVPSRWKGKCQNDSFIGLHCNKKLIGGKFFNKGYLANGGIVPPIQNSARDFEGHGTHTLSTIGGNFVAGANVLGAGNGTAKGGSPRARVAAYKICWPDSGKTKAGCFNIDTVKAMDTAIYDGVDVLSLSLGSDASPYFTDPIAIAGFHAVKNGIPVVCAGGNSGPSFWTAQNVAPWLLTVGASTIDRDFQNLVKLGNGESLKGSSLTKGLIGESYPLITADQAALDGISSAEANVCLNGTLDPSKVEGKIVACLRGENSRLDKGFEVARAGGSGMILYNDKDTGNQTVADPHFLPASHLTYKDGLSLLAYLNTTKNPTGYISASEVVKNAKTAPSMASFSSKGPNPITPAILKPDITAPGVSIIAACPELKSPTNNDIDPRRSRFMMDSGTSMATPHVAGVVGLIKKVHPDWSPAAIKSSIMTTARTRDNRKKPILESTLTEAATPLNYGSGHIRPNRAINPGLVYDSTVEDHLYFLCAVGYSAAKISLFSGIPYNCPKNASVFNYNYPSMTVPDLTKLTSLTRKLKNVGPPGTYVAKVIAPRGISITVDPPTLAFNKIGEEKSFVMNIKKKDGANITTLVVFGKLLWSDGKHYVRSPITIGFGLTAAGTGTKTGEERDAVFKRRGI